MNPSYPIFIVSKGRASKRITQRALDEIGVPYSVIVEEQEYAQYKKHSDGETLVVLPKRYKEEYDTLDDLGLSKSTGPGPARNFAWDLAEEDGYTYHWVMDDNCQHFYRLHQNRKIRVADGTVLRCAEDFAVRFSNVPISGLNYHGLCKSSDRIPPFILNTRIYSFLLIRNDCEFRWRGRYNEDTDLSLRVLKSGGCTIQFCAFLAEKIMTQRVKGGNTAEFYKSEGTKEKSQMLADTHPDVCKVVWKFNRWHHQVDYCPFKGNRLVYREGYTPRGVVNNYGMRLIGD